MKRKIKIFWTIWALGWWRVKTFEGRTSELKVFLGPVVTWWR